MSDVSMLGQDEQQVVTLWVTQPAVFGVVAERFAVVVVVCVCWGHHPQFYA